MSSGAKKNASFTDKLKVGDIVLFFPGGDKTNEPWPLIVSKIEGEMLRGMIVESTRPNFTVGFIRNVNDPWCEEHMDLLHRQGAWGTHDDIPKSDKK